MSELSPNESGNPFFRATLDLAEGQVHQNAPYISPDSKRWVISNSTPIVVAGRNVALLHFESNLDAIRLRLVSLTRSGTAVRVVDSRTSTMIADSRSTKPILGQALAKSSDRPLPSDWQQASTVVATSATRTDRSGDFGPLRRVACQSSAGIVLHRVRRRVGDRHV